MDPKGNLLAHVAIILQPSFFGVALQILEPHLAFPFLFALSAELVSLGGRHGAAPSEARLCAFLMEQEGGERAEQNELGLVS